MKSVTVLAKQVGGLPLPTRASEGSSGFDLRSRQERVVEPDEIALIKTGLFVVIPPGFEGQVRPRSGLAAKHGVTVLNAPGTIDSDYRGEIGVILVNHGVIPFTVNSGTRVAQLVIAALPDSELCCVDEIPDDTERGSGGFGHTGEL